MLAARRSRISMVPVPQMVSIRSYHKLSFVNVVTPSGIPHLGEMRGQKFFESQGSCLYVYFPAATMANGLQATKP